MTLRLRLLLLLVGIVAAGLIISDVVTYNALRSFLTTRVDQQLQVAAFPVGRALLSSSGLGPQVPAAPPDVPVGPGTSSTGPTPTATTQAGGSPTPTNPFASPGTFRNGGGLFGRGRAADRGVLVPPGTYGQLRSPQGTVRGPPVLRLRRQGPFGPDDPGQAARPRPAGQSGLLLHHLGHRTRGRELPGPGQAPGQRERGDRGGRTVG